MENCGVEFEGYVASDDGAGDGGDGADTVYVMGWILGAA